MSTPNPPGSTGKPLTQQAANLAERAADSTESTIRATQNVANEAFDRMSDEVEDARRHVAPLLNRLSAQAETAARRGAAAVRDASAQLREKATQASDTTVEYVRQEPVKAMLIAAATGAVLMALVGLLARSRSD